MNTSHPLGVCCITNDSTYNSTIVVIIPHTSTTLTQRKTKPDHLKDNHQPRMKHFEIMLVKN
jgi:hypothetical protein